MPRHLSSAKARDKVVVEAFTPDGWTGSWVDPVTVRCQVASETVLVDDDAGRRYVTVTKILVPPSMLVDRGALFSPLARVTMWGQSSYVTACAPVTLSGVVTHYRVTTGEDRPFGGGFLVDVVHHKTGGRDSRGNRLPTVDEPLSGVLIVPGESSEPVDTNPAAVTTATLTVPAGTEWASSDLVTVIDSPLTGKWQTDGDPIPHPDRVVVPLKRI